MEDMVSSLTNLEELLNTKQELETLIVELEKLKEALNDRAA